MGSVVNINAKSDNTTLEVDSYECWDVADRTVSAFQQVNAEIRHIATFEQEFSVWDAAYYACLG